VTRLLATVLLVTGATAAVASPLSDALARHSERDVKVLRENRSNVAARCTLGAVYAQRNDLSRAALYLAGCEDAELPVEIAGGVTKIRRELKKKLDDSDLAMIEVVSRPAGMTVSISAFPTDTFTTPATIYVPAGDFEVEAMFGGNVLKNVVHAVKRSRGAVVLDAGAPVVSVKAPKTSKIDMAENGGALDEKHEGPPPAVKHGNMMSDKFQKGIKAVATAEPNPNALDDPFALHEMRRETRPYWLGLRLGGGLFDDTASGARAGIAVAATGRFNLKDHVFLAGRLDWSRRGGEGQDVVDVVGVSAGVGMTMIDTRTIAIALLAQARGDLRLASSRMEVPVHRAGVTFAAGIEAALPRSPFTIGVRMEQGLTTMIPGTRDRAALLELGVDWR